MPYQVGAHFSGVSAIPVDLTVRVPWLYVIAVPQARLVYVGETFDQGGLVVRLGAHFGPYTGSTLRQRAALVAGVNPLRGPFIVVAARLPEGDDALFNGSSKQIRLLVEEFIHQRFAAGYVGQRSGWAVVSQPSPYSIGALPAYVAKCDEMYDGVVTALEFLGTLAKSGPVSLVIIDDLRESEDGRRGIGELIPEIELRIFNWVLSVLRTALGDRWWTDGVPEGVRVTCVTRREQEGVADAVPPEGYLTLIDIRGIVQKNWQLFAEAFERTVQARGKDRATEWFVKLNDIRKLWAHPLKQQYLPVEPGQVDWVRGIHSSLPSFATNSGRLTG